MTLWHLNQAFLLSEKGCKTTHQVPFLISVFKSFHIFLLNFLFKTLPNLSIAAMPIVAWYIGMGVDIGTFSVWDSPPSSQLLSKQAAGEWFLPQNSSNIPLNNSKSSLGQVAHSACYEIIMQQYRTELFAIIQSELYYIVRTIFKLYTVLCTKHASSYSNIKTNLW